MQNLNQDTLVVTGSTGFVGRNLVKQATELGWKVAEIVRDSNAAATGASVRFVIPKFCANDGKANGEWDAVFSGDIPTAVIHLAARAHVLNEGDGDPSTAFRRANVDAALAVAERAFSRGVKRFIFISSIGAVCDMSEPGMPISEASLRHPSTAYGQSKHDAEIALRDLAIKFDGELVIIRPPLVHGIGAPGNLARMARWISKGVPLPFGSIVNQRSLIHVNNLCDVIHACATHPKAAGRVIHVRDLEDYSTPEIIKACARAVGKKPMIFGMPLGVFRVLGKLFGVSRQVAQLTQSLAVDDKMVREELGVMPKKYPLQF